MSQTPGRIEHAIRNVFAGNPSRTFTVAELAHLAYPRVSRIEKKHRVAVLRAAYQMAKATGWWHWQSRQPGHSVVFLNPVNVRSYALGQLRTDLLHASRPISVLEKMLDDPNEYRSCWQSVRPGGVWWRHVEIIRAERVKEREQATALGGDPNATIQEKLLRVLPTPP